MMSGVGKDHEQGVTECPSETQHQLLHAALAAAAGGAERQWLLPQAKRGLRDGVTCRD